MLSFSRKLSKFKPFIDFLGFDHFLALTDETGMLQHSKFSVPDWRLGYATEDNARAQGGSAVGALAVAGVATGSSQYRDLALKALSWYHGRNQRAPCYMIQRVGNARTVILTGSKPEQGR